MISGNASAVASAATWWTTMSPGATLLSTRVRTPVCRRVVPPITRIERPVDRAVTQITGDVQHTRVTRPEGRPKPGFARSSEVRLDHRIGVFKLPDNLLTAEQRQVRVEVGVVGELVSVRSDLAGELGIALDPLARQEKGDLELMCPQDGQDRAGRAVHTAGVEGERDQVAVRVTTFDFVPNGTGGRWSRQHRPRQHENQTPHQPSLHRPPPSPDIADPCGIT